MNSKDRSNFFMSKSWMWDQFKDRQDELDRIAKDGISSPADERLARAACSFISSDIMFEEDIKSDDISPEILN